MACKVCGSMGMIPRCPFCKKKGRISKLNKIKENAEKERLRLNEQAFNQFKAINAKGSGCDAFDEDVRDTHGDWKS